jgi:hypothetical protein
LDVANNFKGNVTQAVDSLCAFLGSDQLLDDWFNATREALGGNAKKFLVGIGSTPSDRASLQLVSAALLGFAIATAFREDAKGTRDLEHISEEPQ